MPQLYYKRTAFVKTKKEEEALNPLKEFFIGLLLQKKKSDSFQMVTSGVVQKKKKKTISVSPVALCRKVADLPILEVLSSNREQS